MKISLATCGNLHVFQLFTPGLMGSTRGPSSSCGQLLGQQGQEDWSSVVSGATSPEDSAADAKPGLKEFRGNSRPRSLNEH